MVIERDQVSVELGTEAVRQDTQQFEKVLVVASVPENGLLLVAAGGDEVAATGQLDTQRLCRARGTWLLQL